MAIPVSLSQNGPNEPVLFHYTSYSGLAGIVSSKSIWCSKIQYLNDSSELRHGLRLLARVGEKYFPDFPILSHLQDYAERYTSINVFVSSLSDSRDTLSQWRGYSTGSGVAIEFSHSKLLLKAQQQGFQLVQCKYNYQEQTGIIKQFLESQLSMHDAILTEEEFLYRLVSNFIPIAASFKDPSFSEEAEWRLISPILDSMGGKIQVRTSQSGLIPYAAFDLATGNYPLLSPLQPWRKNEDICISAVMVGPNKEQELQMDAVGQLFESYCSYVGGVGRSAIPFRSYYFN